MKDVVKVIHAVWALSWSIAFAWQVWVAGNTGEVGLWLSGMVVLLVLGSVANEKKP